MLKIFDFPPALSENVTVRYAHQTYVERLRIGGESRSQMSSHFLREWVFNFVLEKAQAQKARDFFNENVESLIRFPDWLQPAVTNDEGLIEKFEHVDYACKELLVISKDQEQYAIVEREADLTAQVFPPNHNIYPIRIGRIKQIPQFPSFGDDVVLFTCTFSEDVTSREFQFNEEPIESFRTFRGRPVYPFYYKDLSESWQNNVTYNKKSFGVETSYKRENFPKREISLSLLQDGRKECREFIDFFDIHKGRAHGFWLSTGRANYQVEGEVTAGATTLELDSEFIKMREGVDYIELRTFGKESEYHRVTEVNGNTITLEEPVEMDRTEKTAVSLLYAVRFSDDSISLSFDGDEICRATLKFIELLEEYDNAALVKQPRYIYEFSGFWGGNLTSYGEEFTQNGQVYTPANITHGRISYRSQSLRSSCEVKFTPVDDDHPLYVFRQGFPTEQIRVKITKINGANETFLYEANAVNIQYSDQREITINLGSFAEVVDSELPTAHFESRCSRRFLRPGCNLEESDFEVNGSLVSSVDTLVQVKEAEIEAAARGFDDWFLNGQIMIGNERRTIIGQQGAQLFVSTPFIIANQGDPVRLLPGCNRTTVYCINRYNNYQNFGGMPFIPSTNPQFESIRINSTIPQGGKK